MTPSLYEWAGGAPAIERLTEVCYRHVHQDSLLALLFAHVGDDHPHHVAIWLSEVFGGPATYTAEHGGYPAMLSHHIGLSITPEQRARWAALSQRHTPRSASVGASRAARSAGYSPATRPTTTADPIPTANATPGTTIGRFLTNA